MGVKKMRLIDADVFKTEYENLITWVSHRAEKARLREFIKDIQNQPTVKAIPIELYEQVKGERDIAIEQLKSLNIELFEKPYLKAITIEWIKNWFNPKYANTVYYSLLRDMIKDWEKENETD